MTGNAHETPGQRRPGAADGDATAGAARPPGSAGSAVRRIRLVAATATITVAGLALLAAGVASGRWQLLGAAACWLAAAAAAFWTLRALPASGGGGTAGRGRLAGWLALCLGLLVAGTAFMAQLG